ncbi:MAG: hypothetical protein MJ213_04750 [Bacilli bacterium]|nr:hypothetical protein [Bacilli bacterium]
MAKSKMSNEKKKKIKIGVLASLGGLVLIGGGVCIGYFGKETINYFFNRERDTTIDKVQSEYQIDPYLDLATQKNWKYINSSESKIIGDKLQGETFSAHTFLLGNVTNVPFYTSAWTKFSYEDIGMEISYSQIKAETISTSESQSTEKTKSSYWKDCSKINNKLELEVSGGIGPVKATAKNTLDIEMTKERGGSSTSKYVSNSSKTMGSIESLSKTSDYSIKLNSNNGFKKGKYYRLSLQQKATEYLIVYEHAAKDATEETKYDGGPGKFFELTSYLDNPSDYTMIIEETDDPNEEAAGADFDENIVDECTTWIEEQRSRVESGESEFNYIGGKDDPSTGDVRKEFMDQIFGDEVVSLDSDIYERNTEYRINDDGPEKNPCDVISFESLFNSRFSPTFRELFNKKDAAKDEDKGYGFSSITVTIECEVKQYDRGDNHIYIYNTTESNIPKKVLWEHKEDYDTKSWTKVRYTATEFSEEDIRTSVVPTEADGKIIIRYDGSGFSDDDWGVRKLRVKVNISK